jgi:cbb3-type cytochrome c oxidase subunit III
VSKRRDSRLYFRLPAVALAVAVLFGCGGGGSDSALTQQPLAVQLHETSTMLSVKADLSSSGERDEFEAQALNFTFAAQIDSGRDAGQALKGVLELKGEREDDGVTEVEGRFFPDANTLPSGADLKAEFHAKRKALGAALRVDIKAQSSELQLALSSGAVRGSDRPSAAQKEALAAFKSKFSERMAAYDAAMTALNAEYRGANRAQRSRDDDDDNDRQSDKGYEVRGTIDANGAIKLKVNLGDKGTVIATGTTAADGSLTGSLTGPASDDKGTWTATAIDGTATPPPPAPPVVVPPVEPPVVVVPPVEPPVVVIPPVEPPVVVVPPVEPPVVVPPVVPPVVIPPPTGNVAAGATVYSANCSGCHGTDPASNSLNVKRANTLSALNSALANVGAMRGFQTSLTATQKLDLAAYIASR